MKITKALLILSSLLLYTIEAKNLESLTFKKNLSMLRKLKLTFIRNYLKNTKQDESYQEQNDDEDEESDRFEDCQSQSLSPETQEEPVKVVRQASLGLLFPSNKRIYSHDRDYPETVVIVNKLPEEFQIQIRILKMKKPGYVMLGLINSKNTRRDVYIGGSLGEGSWGISSNRWIGEEGRWISNSNAYFREGDIVTIGMKENRVRFRVNDVQNSYEFEVKWEEVHFGASLFHEGDAIEIVHSKPYFV